MPESRSALRIRPATPADLDVLLEFNAGLALETEGRTLDRARLARGLELVLGDRERGAYRVAERGGAVVGALLVTREWSDWRAGWFWWIQSVYVARSARGSGVYRALHASVFDEARAAGDVCGVRLYVDRENLSAQAVYRHLGMHEARYAFFERDFVLEG